MSKIKRRFFIYLIAVLILVILLCATLAISKLNQVRINYQLLNRNNNLAREATGDTKDALAFIQTYLSKIEIINDRDSLKDTEEELLKFQRKFDSNYNVLKMASIDSGLKNKIFASEKKYSEYSNKLINTTGDYLDLKMNLSDLERGVLSSSRLLEEALYMSNLDDIAKDVAQLNSFEMSNLLAAAESSQFQMRRQIERGLKMVEAKLLSYERLSQLEEDNQLDTQPFEGQQLYAYLREHRDKWQALLKRIEKMSRTREDLSKDLDNSIKAGQNLNLDLSTIEKEIFNSIREANLILDSNQNRIKLLSISAGIIFLAGSIYIFFKVRRPVRERAEPESSTSEQTEAEVPVYTKEVQKVTKGLQKEDIQQMKKVIERAVDELLKDKTNILNLTKDAYTGDYLYHHSVNVAILAIRVGLGLGLDKERLISLGMSALLHDIGMVEVPREIVDKQGRLNKQEYEQVKRHPDFGLKILEDISQIEQEIRYAVSEHHERYSGVGYPKGLTKDEIHQFAKIIGLVDIYEALTHSRVYRQKSFSHQEAIDEIRKLDKQSLFDKQILDVFLKEIA